MALHLHRSNRVEALVAQLCKHLSACWPDDPFERVPIVVGSGGMARYLRHELATQTGIASGLDFPFPRPAFAGAANWLLAGATDARAEFWSLSPALEQAAMRFERESLAFRLVGLLRTHREAEGFENVREYLAEGAASGAHTGPVPARELSFASDVADVLDHLMHDRPLDALAWARKPSTANEAHRWLATLLRDLEAAQDERSSALCYERLCKAVVPKTGRTLCVFGLSTLGPGDRARVAEIARGIDVHLFVLAPSRQWLGDHQTRAEHRRALRDAKPDALARLEFEQHGANPVVAALGAPSRDLQDWLEEAGYIEGAPAFEEPSSKGAEPTLLTRLHAWMLDAEGLDSVNPPWPLDALPQSVQFHSTYGALRQCEVLREELLGLFAADPTLEPRDVVVMTPDIETYAPLVAAVFARQGAAEPRLPMIPTAIADLGLSRTNPMAEVMLALLELVSERVTATRVSSLLALAPVRTRFEIGDDDLGALQELIRTSGLRWGLDDDDRAQVGQPRRDQNTVRFAGERLALGLLMPDEDPLGVVRGLNNELGPAVPLEAPGAAAVQQAGALLELLRTLRVHRTALAGPLPMPVWRERLLRALDDMAETADTSAWLRAEVVAALDALVEQAAPLGELAVDREALRKWLTGGFELSQRGDRVITGAVTVCALQPMRSVPFRVVALLGMDDKAFPRGTRTKLWDPFEQRRAGERDGREVDRHLLLEALLSAREQLIVLWSGHEVQTGKPQPAAVPIEELLETLGVLTGEARNMLVREHPLQPWSEQCFLPPHPTSHDAGLAKAATLRRALRAGTSTTEGAGLLDCRRTLLPEEPNPIRELSIDRFVAALYRPQKTFLKERLGLWLDTDETVLEDREPLDLKGLERNYDITQQVLDGLRGLSPETDARAVVDTLEARLAGEGELPLRAGGRRLLEVHERLARAVLHNAAAVAGAPHASLPLAWASASGLRLVGQVNDVREHHGKLLLQWTSVYGHESDFGWLKAWVHLLAAAAAGHTVAAARVVGPSDDGKTKRAVGAFLAPGEYGAADAARAMLEDLTAIYQRARRTAVSLFRYASPAAAGVLKAIEDGTRVVGARTKLQGAVSTAWYGNDFGQPGDCKDPSVVALFSDYNPADDLEPAPDGFHDLASRVWLPVYRAAAAGKAIAVDLKPDSQAAGGADDQEDA